MTVREAHTHLPNTNAVAGDGVRVKDFEKRSPMYQLGTYRQVVFETMNMQGTKLRGIRESVPFGGHHLSLNFDANCPPKVSLAQ